MKILNLIAKIKAFLVAVNELEESSEYLPENKKKIYSALKDMKEADGYKELKLSSKEIPSIDDRTFIEVYDFYKKELFVFLMRLLKYKYEKPPPTFFQKLSPFNSNKMNLKEGKFNNKKNLLTSILNYITNYFFKTKIL